MTGQTEVQSPRLAANILASSRVTQGSFAPPAKLAGQIAMSTVARPPPSQPVEEAVLDRSNTNDATSVVAELSRQLVRGAPCSDDGTATENALHETLTKIKRLIAERDFEFRALAAEEKVTAASTRAGAVGHDDELVLRLREEAAEVERLERELGAMDAYVSSLEDHIQGMCRHLHRQFAMPQVRGPSGKVEEKYQWNVLTPVLAAA